MTVYLDTSVFVSLMTTEAHSDRARAFVFGCGDRIMTSNLGWLEANAAFGRWVRMKSLGPVQARSALSELRAWVGRSATETPLQATDFTFAESALTRFSLGLKTPDALHIAIAQRLGARIATLDQHQASAAHILGVSAVEP